MLKLWVVAALWMSASGKPAVQNPKEPHCAPPRNDTGAQWRPDPQDLVVVLNETNVACLKGNVCENATQETSSSFSNIIYLEIQLGDKLSIDANVTPFGNRSRNGTFDVLVLASGAEMPKECDLDDASGVADSETADLSLDQLVSKPGVQGIFVRYELERGCDAVWKIQIQAYGHECSKNKDQALCSGKGFCDNFSNTGFFSCRCCSGYVGKYCEERDGCHGNPCQHGGFCVDIAEGLFGTTYQCLCPHGYRGRSCEDEVNLCDRKPCLNNGTCHGNQTDYTCECTAGFRGPDCETNVNECLSNPCVHGVCEDGMAAYKCYCLPGYGGDHCEFEYDECDSSPCINGGACEDLVAGYRCHCGPGYQGRRCQIKVDLCQPNPCPSPAQCVDRGNNYSCVCHPGYNGPGCTQHYDPCYPNPCQNGGSCWPSLDSYFCSCRPGFTGDLCEETLLASQPLPRTLDDPGEPEEDSKSGRDASRGAMEDHWHNLYLVGTMLTLAATVIVLIAVVCHCRINGTYLKFTRRLSKSCAEIKQQKLEDPGKFSLNLRGSASEGTSRANDPSYEASSVDLTDNLNAPLIC